MFSKKYIILHLILTSHIIKSNRKYLPKEKTMKIYCINNKFSIPEEISNCFISLIDDSKLAKIRRYRNRRDYENALAADILVRYAILENTKMKYFKKPFLFNEYGKPYLPTSFNLQFNVSHSGEWVVCAVDERAVGIDVELMQETDMLELAHRFFTIKEYDMLSNADKSLRKELFYDTWTLKESYIKALGKGLSIKLDSFSITLADNMISCETQMQHEQCYFKQYYIDNTYKLSVCSFGDSFPSDVIYLDINDMHKKLSSSGIR